jgi:ADP-ribose pyrophosphatase YjhB (NUDIX family)
VDGLGYWFLPGGRVRFGESSDAALARELAEELGHVLPAGQLALVVENIFDARTVSMRSACITGSPSPQC